tara:strand:- start:752 stop:979 length:228 start_codon:yes stop_codon:yes gene_type:complete
MAITFRITETGKENSKTIFQTTDWFEAKEWLSTDTHAWPRPVIHYDGVDGMSIKDFNKLYDHPHWPIKVKQVVID